MKPGQRFLTLGIVVSCLSATVLSCRMNLGGPEGLASPPAASDAAATEASRSWSSALAGAVDSGQLTVIVTEEQLTSALASRLAAEQDPLLQSPQVYLRDGTIQIFGVAQEGMFEATVRLVITPVLDDEGRLGFELTAADFGPIPAPDGLKSGLSGMLSEALAGPMGTLATGIRITSVAIADGALAIVAELR